MLRSLCFAFALSLTLITPVLAADCELLPESALRQVIPKLSGTLTQTVQVPGRCRYLWPKPDQTARDLENQQRYRDAMRRGHEDTLPLPIWNEVNIELLAEGDSVAAVKELFEDYLTQHLPKHYGSPDPLENLALTKTPAPEGRQQAWNSQTRQLLIQSGKRLLLLGVNVEDDNEKNKALTLLLATQTK